LASSASSPSTASSSRVDPAPALFLCLFAVQAGVIALSPVLAQVAADFGVSTATAGQRIRTAATQFGYLLGSALGGIALAAGGYAALGAAFGVMFLLAAVPHAAALSSWTARPSA